MNHRGTGHPNARRLGACRASLAHYADFLSGSADAVIIGRDFNNSVVWDKPGRAARFGDFMDDLARRGFASAYHRHYAADRGAEPHPTLWWRRNTASTYHIDYTFVSPSAAVHHVSVGEHADWIAYSDHSPMTVDLRVTCRNDALTPPIGKYVSGDSKVKAVPHQAIRQPVAANTVGPTTPRTAARSADLVRIPLPAGSLPNMPCGVNGAERVQTFRPTSFTAEWSGNVLIDVENLWAARSPGRVTGAAPTRSPLETRPGSRRHRLCRPTASRRGSDTGT